MWPREDAQGKTEVLERRGWMDMSGRVMLEWEMISEKRERELKQDKGRVGTLREAEGGAHAPFLTRITLDFGLVPLRLGNGLRRTLRNSGRSVRCNTDSGAMDASFGVLPDMTLPSPVPPLPPPPFQYNKSPVYVNSRHLHPLQ